MQNNLHKEPTAITVIKVKTGTSSGRSLSVFVDESGDFEFRNNDTRYFVMAGFITETPDECSSGINRLKYSFLTPDTLPQLPFHAVNNSAKTRSRFISALCDSDHNCDVEVVFCDKYYAPQKFQSPDGLYLLTATSLTKRVLAKFAAAYDEIVFIFDVAVSKRVQSLFKRHLKEKLEAQNVKYSIIFYPVKHEPCGQIADYYAWASYRFLAAGDPKHLDALPLKPKLISIFAGRKKRLWFPDKK